METESKNNSGDTSQITFKLTIGERQHSIETAEFLGINVSEYCRAKCLSEENTVIEERNKVAQLEKEIKSLKVKLTYYKNSERDSNSVLLKFNAKQKEIIEKLYNGFYSGNEDLESN